jgi:hypothetical protein
MMQATNCRRKNLISCWRAATPKREGIIQGAIEEFSHELALVIRRFLKLKDWKHTERIVVGGGFRVSRIGEWVIGRTAVILKADRVDVKLLPIHNEANEAGLLSAVHLAPTWMFKAFEAILAVDIGGTNIRTGVVQRFERAGVGNLQILQGILDPGGQRCINGLRASCRPLVGARGVHTTRVSSIAKTDDNRVPWRAPPVPIPQR